MRLGLSRAFWGAALVVACNGGANSPPTPPITPILEAVLLPGPFLQFSRHILPVDLYEALPSAMVILRMASAYPGDAGRISIALLPVGGSASTPLAYVAREDQTGKQRLASSGFFEVVVDNAGYSLLVTPSPAARSGSGFDLSVTNSTPNPPAGTNGTSPTLMVKIRPKVARTLPSDVFFDCGESHDEWNGRWTPNCVESESIIAGNFTLQGWVIKPFFNCDDTMPGCLHGTWLEDFHYDFIPDVDFIEKYYGTGGVVASIVGNTDAMNNLTVKGNPVAPGPGVALLDRKPDGTPRGITLNSFVHTGNRSAGSNVVQIHGELNAWHKDPEGADFSRHWVGRGAPPAGWPLHLVAAGDPHHAAWANAFWPFEPTDPEGRLTPLMAGDYVRVTGALWQDVPHESGVTPTAHDAPWSFFNPRLGAWIEIHPVDWVERVSPPAVRKTPAIVDAINSDATPAQQTTDLAPEDSRPAGAVLRCRELVDGRLTDMTSVTQHTVTVADDHVQVVVAVERRIVPGTPNPPGPTLNAILPGRFKAVYVLWWEAGGSASPTCASQ